MHQFNKELVDSGELVESRGLSAPVHARRVRSKEETPVVTDGPYAEAEEVLTPATGSWNARASIADRSRRRVSAGSPGPEHLRSTRLRRCKAYRRAPARLRGLRTNGGRGDRAPRWRATCCAASRLRSSAGGRGAATATFNLSRAPPRRRR